MADLLTELLERRARFADDLLAKLGAAQRDGRNQMTAQERADRRVIDGLTNRIDELRAETDREAQIGANLAHLGHTANLPATLERRTMTPITSRPRGENTAFDASLVYQKRGRASWLRDLVQVQTGRDVDGSGGYAVPPAWLMQQYVEVARPGRAFADAVQRQPLPGGTDSINIPKMLTGTSVAVQTADNQDVSEVDLTDTFINAPVRTIAGQQGISLQIIDQSPVAFDDIVFRDLVAAHDAVLDGQCLAGSGVNGQVLGVANTPKIGTVAATNVDIKGFYSAIANAIQKVHTTRFLPPEAIILHPRRWCWYTSLLDASERPLVLGSAFGPMNVAGTLDVVASQQIVGEVQGLPVIMDPNITTTAGAGANEDIVYVARVSDAVLWESGVRCRVLPKVRAQSLTVLLQIYSYLAFTAARLPQSFIQITGLTAPTWT
jgi:HK97 family phage major capsid protein